MWCVFWDRWVRHAAKAVHRCVTGQQRCPCSSRLVWACTVGCILLWLLLRVFHRDDGWLAGLPAVGDPTTVLVEVLEVALDHLCDTQWSWRLRALVTVPAAMMGLGSAPHALVTPRVCLGLGVRWQTVTGGNDTASATPPGSATHRFPVSCTPTMADVALATSGSVELDWRDVPMRIDEHVLPRLVALRQRNSDRTLHVVSVYMVMTATVLSAAGSAEIHDVTIGVAAPLMAATDLTSWSLTSWQVDPATTDALGLSVTLHAPPSSTGGNLTNGAGGAPWSLPDAWATPRVSQNGVPVASQIIPYHVHLRPGALQLTLPSMQLLLFSPRDTLVCAPDAICVGAQPDEHEPTWGTLTADVRWHHEGIQVRRPCLLVFCFCFCFLLALHIIRNAPFSVNTMFLLRERVRMFR
jgi:hypothetical protein